MEKKPEAIIQTICGSIEDRIDACADRHVAQLLKERLCSELREGCKSEIVNNFLDKIVDELIKRKFRN
ncbi:MAG: hypothetical protein ACOY90_16505 [Candidatus Zhuqueibacterota bacterium]